MQFYVSAFVPMLRNYLLASMGHPTWCASRFRPSSRVCQSNVFFSTGLHMRELAAIPPAFYSECRSASFVFNKKTNYALEKY